MSVYIYDKEHYVFGEDRKPRKLRIRNYRETDFAGLIDIQRECFPPPFPSELWWNEDQLLSHVTRFPEGALCAEMDGRLIGSMTGLVVMMKRTDTDHSWVEVTDSGYIRNHDSQGNTLYVVDISVRPAYRKHGIGKWLMHAMYEVVIQLGLDRLLGGGRMSGYHRVAEQMSAEAYLEAVLRSELSDPVISFLLRCGRTPIGVAADYLEDEESCNYAALMEWKNPFIR